VLGLDESKTFASIKPLYGTSFHSIDNPNIRAESGAVANN